MIDNTVKFNLLKAIDDLVARIMVQAGLDENEVKALVLSLIASTQEALNPAIADKLITPSTAAAIVENLLNANIGNAPTELNSIEKLAAAIPNLATSLGEVISELDASLREIIRLSNEGVSGWVGHLATFGFPTPLDLRNTATETLKLLSTDLVDLMALTPGTYTGIVKASALRIEKCFGVSAGVPFDEDVTLRITHVRIGSFYSNTREAITSRGTYLATWKSNVSAPNVALAVWLESSHSTSLFSETATEIALTDTSQFDFLGVLELSGTGYSGNVPHLDFDGQYQVARDWIGYRQKANDLIFWVTTNKADQGQWYLIADAEHKAGVTGDTDVEWLERGATIIDSGGFIDLNTPGLVGSELKWIIDLNHGEANIYVHGAPGTPIRDLTPVTGVDPIGDFSFSIKMDTGDNAPAIYMGELALRLTCMDLVNNTEHSRSLRLTHKLDTRIQQSPIDDQTVGDFRYRVRKGVSGENDSVISNGDIQAYIGVSTRAGRRSKMRGELATTGVFTAPSFRAVGIDFGLGSIANIPVDLTVTYDCELALTYGSATKQFKYVNIGGVLGLREVVSGVVQATDYTDVTHHVSDMVQCQESSLDCYKVEVGFSSHLEQMFPLATNYVSRLGDIEDEDYYGNTGTVSCVLTCTPKVGNLNKAITLTASVILTS